MHALSTMQVNKGHVHVIIREEFLSFGGDAKTPAAYVCVLRVFHMMRCLHCIENGTACVDKQFP